ncbi:MAG: hypothetical protein PVF71_05410, partial [Desulfobacterales bacterium]
TFCNRNVFLTTTIKPLWQAIIGLFVCVVQAYDEKRYSAEVLSVPLTFGASTLLISKDNLKRFLAAVGHEVKKLAVPSHKT